MLSGLSWILSARKWFKGPVPNITADEMTKVGGPVCGEIHSQSPVNNLLEVQDKSSSDRSGHKGLMDKQSSAAAPSHIAELDSITNFVHETL